MRSGKMNKWISLLLAVTLLVAGSGIPETIVMRAYALQEPDERDNAEPHETKPQETKPQETVPQETQPEETGKLYEPDEVPPTQAPPAQTPPVKEPEPQEPAPQTPPIEVKTDNILHYAEMPMYYQNDYPDVMYGSGTVANNGCSATALAMVATYMTGHDYDPEMLANYFGGRAENNVERLEIGNDKLKLTHTKAKNWHYVYEALKKGKVAIVLVAAPTSFTGNQHFLVLNGITKDGKVLVMDPNRDNYLKWDLQKGFENGFEPYDIWTCYEGGWIYDKQAMPKNPIYYQEKGVDKSNPRYPNITLTKEDKDLIARVVWAEARGESDKGQQAVAEIVLNRLNSANFPDNLHDVIYGEGQFRTAWLLDKAEPYQTQYEAIERAIYGPYVLPTNVVYFAWEKENDKVWGKIGKHVFCYEHDAVLK